MTPRNAVVRTVNSRPAETFYDKPVAKTDQHEPAKLTSDQELAALKDRLGTLDRIAINSRARAEKRRIIGEIIVNALEKQKQLLLFKMTLELSDEKKRLFAEYLRTGAIVEREIAQRSTEHEDALIDFVLDTAIEAQEKKERRLQGLHERRGRGQLTDQAYDEEIERTERWAHLHLANLDAKIEIMLRNHAEIIAKALVLFNERAIPGAAL